MKLRAPFPYFGGKSRVAADVWRRLGDVDGYIEPFCGSAAVLLAAPHKARNETLNDASGSIVNFWRSVKNDPDTVARWCDEPRFEVDLAARSREYRERSAGLAEKLRESSSAFDADLAGMWAWGQSVAIMGGWPTRPGKPVRARQGMTRASTGINEIRRLVNRLSGCRILCGSWERTLTQAELAAVPGCIGIFLDPPYGDVAERDMQCYGETDSGSVAADVRSWAVAAGDDRRLRIALCGYKEEHESEIPDSWERFAWKAHGGMGNRRKETRGRANRERERIWFSPGCHRPERQTELIFQMDSAR